MSLAPGTRIGPYEVLRLIGAGGMGEVYRARDTRLRREVAIKRISSVALADPDRVRRFEQEALAAASLNHPNVLSVFDVGVHDAAPYLVSELLEGETLRDSLRGGRLPPRTAIDLTLQLLAGLAAAHERGIVHRDLKPENVFLTRDGRIKILDFGVAKLVEAVVQSSEAPTETTLVRTERGAVIGTVGYMAPEQVRAQVTDHRADIFAVGAILYELLSGQRAFKRDTSAETMTAILNDDAPPFANVKVSTAIERIVRRCLEKRPEQRLESARDVAFALEAVADDASGIPAAVAPATGPRRRGTAVGIVTGVLAAAFGVLIGRSTLAPPASPAPEVRVHRLTDWVGLEETPAISTDGRSVAFVAPAGGSRHIWVRLLAGGAPLQLTRDSGDHLFPRWSPDSNAVLYFTPAAQGAASGALWEVPALGGPPRRIADGIGAADISHDGKEIAFFKFESGRVELVVAARDGTAPRSIAQLEVGYYYLSPRWSPDDKVVAYQRSISNVWDVFAVSVDGGQPQPVTRDGTIQEGFAWANGSRIVFSSARGATIYYLPTLNLWSVALDGSDMRQLTFGEASYANPDVNLTSGVIVASRLRVQSDIWQIPGDGTPVDNVARATRVTRQTSHVHAPSPAPDGTRVAYVSDAGGHANIWVHTLPTGESRQLTFEQEADVLVGLPVWSPTGDQITYFTSRRGLWTQWLVGQDGSNRRLLVPNAGSVFWSPDGRWLYFNEGPIGERPLKKLPVSGGPTVTVRGGRARLAAISPDGRTLYYMVENPILTGGSEHEVWAATPENAPGRLLAKIGSHRLPWWHNFQPFVSPDGQWLLFALVDDPTTNLWALSTKDGELRRLTDFQRRATVMVRRAAWAPDGRSVLAAVGERDADVVVLDGLKAR